MHSIESLDKKINPPIRKLATVNTLWERLKDIATENKLLVTVGTDHAPHKEEEKMKKYLSGFPGLIIYNDLLKAMRNHGFTEDQIDNLTYWNAKKVFPKIKE
jgi:dihydroorotase-like cyclic amidohydrolase